MSNIRRHPCHGLWNDCHDGQRGKFEVFYAFLRVLATEREVAGSQSQRAGRLVTQRQHEILSLIKAGKTNSEIAEVLSRSQWTIKNHVQATPRKLDSNTRTHAIAWAKSLGIPHPD